MLLELRLEFSLPISSQENGVADKKILSLHPHASSIDGTVTVKFNFSQSEGGQRIMEYLDGASNERPVSYSFAKACPKLQILWLAGIGWFTSTILLRMFHPRYVVFPRILYLYVLTIPYLSSTRHASLNRCLDQD